MRAAWCGVIGRRETSLYDLAIVLLVKVKSQGWYSAYEASRLVGADDELAQEFVAQAVKVVTVELGAGTFPEVGFCCDSLVQDTLMHLRCLDLPYLLT